MLSDRESFDRLKDQFLLTIVGLFDLFLKMEQDHGTRGDGNMWPSLGVVLVELGELSPIRLEFNSGSCVIR